MGNILFSYLQNNNNNYVEYSRDSFSHRICDDLCEVILQYLSLDDKIRFECVSQQFQRTVFQRQHELRINFTDSHIIARIIVKSFEKLLKKCTNIRSVYITNNSEDILYLRNRNIEYNDFIEMITSNCQYLSKINIDLFMIDNLVLEKFINVFGQSLKGFKLIYE